MAGHRLIEDYARVLRAELPGPLADEVADGLAESYAKHVGAGLSSDEAARAAVAEFGAASGVVEGFTSACPARRVARRLIVTGPAVGSCWALGLIAGHAWDWPVPAAARALAGAMLVACVVALARAALGHRYRAVQRAGTAGIAGLAAVDAIGIGLVLAAAPKLSWALALAAMASAARLTYVTRALPLHA